MKIKILCIGKIKEKYLNEGINEFLKRLKVYAKVDIVEKKEERISESPSQAEIDSVLESEGLSMLKEISSDDYVIILDLHGKEVDNLEFLKLFDKAMVDGQSSFVFVIGGSYGISEDLRKRADFKWSFSKLTFTHQMIRLLLVEQIYRTFRIKHNQPYHK